MIPIRRICLLPLLGASLALSQAAPVIPSGPWTDIYNGKDFTGWSYAGNPPWSITGGILTAKGGTIKTMMIWNEPLKDVEVEVTYRLSTASANGGIQVRSQCKERTDAFPKCGNYQVCGLQLDVAMNYSGKLFEECTGFLVNSGQHVDDCRRSLKVGDWMTTTARFNGSSFSLWLNGAHCLDYTFTKVEHLQGTIFALQSHPPYDPIDYKSVRIRKLNVAAVAGCTNPSASNYNPQATQDDGSCKLTSLIGSRDIAQSARVYRNGAAVRFDIPTPDRYSVRLVDAFGIVLREESGMGPRVAREFALPSRGIYFLEMETRGSLARHRIINL